MIKMHCEINKCEINASGVLWSRAQDISLLKRDATAFAGRSVPSTNTLERRAGVIVEKF